jgi:hypothetical protein
MAAPDPFPGGGGSGPPRPVEAVRPVEVWPPYVAAPDLPGSTGPWGPPESTPALMGAWRPRTYKSTGVVRRP